MGTLAGKAAEGCKSACREVACRFVFLVLGISIVLPLTPTPAWAHRNDQPGILLLYYRQKEAAYGQVIKSELTKTLSERLSRQCNIYADSVEGWSGTDAEGDTSLLQVLKQRYSRLNIHLLVPVGNTAVEFARQHSREFVPEASIVYMAESFVGQPEIPPILEATGVIVRFDPEASLQIALQQNPNTRQVVVITGSSAQERIELASAQNEYRRYRDSLHFQYVTNLTFAELLAQVSKLPRNAVVILLNFSQDSAGDEFLGSQILPSISRASVRPIYVVYSPGVGAGAVGGRVHDFGRIGRALGRLAAEVLEGKRAGDLPLEEGTFQESMFDWRQMQRWGIQPDQLPAGSIILNRELTGWEKYRWWILGTLALLGAQAGLISFLTVAQMRKTRAERELANEVDLESLVSELAMAFVNIPVGRVGEQIEHSCDRLLRFFHVDRIGIFEFSGGKDVLRLLYSHHTPGTEAFPAEVKSGELQWLKAQALAGEPILLSSLNDIPASSAADRDYMDRRGVRSAAIVPLMIQQDVSGILVLASVTQEAQWPARIVERLLIVSRIFANVLDKKRADEALQASEDLKTSVLDSLVSHLAVITRTGKIVAINKSWKDYWIENGGASQGDMGMGANYLDICRKAAESGCREADRALTGVLSVLEGRSELFEMEYDCSSPDQERWFIMVVTPLLHACEGAVIRHRDITFRMQALGMLREGEERFRLVADSAPVMIWMAGPDRLCNYFNKGWLDFRGRSMEQESGEGWKEGIHPDDLARCLRTYNESFDSQRPFTLEYRLSRADGRHRWVLESGAPRRMPGGTFAGFIGACIDITEQKESDHARAQLSGLLITAQEEDRASIARELHDHVNQRLALLAIELQQFEATAARLSDKERDELDHLWDLTNEISHDVQALSHQLHSSQLQHLGLVAGVRSLCQEFSKSNDVEAECRCIGVVPRIDENVSLALFRVAQEALRNASKYSRARLVQADLHCEHDVLTLRVTDDGVGFDPTTVDGGGLGLISMRERMRLVGGELIVHSKPGAGTQIEGRVPLVHEVPQKFPPEVPMRVERRKRERA